MMTNSRLRWTLLLTAVLSACGPDLATVDDSDPEAGEAAGALCTGKDVDGLAEGSLEAIGVLRVANTSDLATLRTGPRLTKATAQNVVARRDGPDGQPGTGDDKRFTSLADLSSVCGVGSAAIHSLMLWALAHPVTPVDAGTVFVDAGTTPVDAGTVTDAGATTPDAGPVDPWPTCTGAPRFPVTGDLSLSYGQQTTWSRTCDAWGACSAWTQEGVQRSVSQDNGPRSLLITTGGSVYISAQIGYLTSSQSGSDTYYCSDFDLGSGRMDLTTGEGPGTMGSGYRCNISGGSGGPYGNDPQRAVTFKLGASCLSVTDQAPTTSYGVQRRRVMVIPY